MAKARRRRRRRARRWPYYWGAFLACFFIAYSIVYRTWNDEAIARTVSRWVSKPMRGYDHGFYALKIGRAHYPYWGGLASLLFNTPVYVEVWDASVTDPDGAEVLAIPHARGQMYVRETVLSQLVSALPLTRYDLELHFANAHVETAHCRITAARSREGKPSVNLVEAFSPKVKKQVDGGMRIQLDGATVDDVDFRIEFPGWRGHLEHLAADADLRVSTFPEENNQGKPGRLAFNYTVRQRVDGEWAGRPLSPRGELTLGTGLPKPYVFPLEDLRLGDPFGAFAPATEDLAFDGTTRTRGAKVAVKGVLHDCYSGAPAADLTIQFDDASGMLAMLPTNALIGGRPSGSVSIKGPLTHVVIDGDAAGGELHAGTVVARDARAHFTLDGPKLAVSHGQASVAGGQVSADALIDFTKLTWRANLVSDRVDPAQLEVVPPAAREELAGRLTGRARVEGSMVDHPERIRVRDLDVRLERRARDRLPPELALSGGLEVTPERVQLDDLSLHAQGATALARGSIDPKRATADGDLTVDASHLGPLLERLGIHGDLGQLVGELHLRTHVAGSLYEPTLDGVASATTAGDGRRLTPKLDAKVRFEHGTLRARDITGSGPLGGDVAGEVSVGLFDGRFDRPRADHPITAAAVAHGLSVETLTANPNMTGLVDGSVEIGGTVERPTGSAKLLVPALSFYGDSYSDGRLDVALPGDDAGGFVVQRMQLVRAGGGEVGGKGRIAADGGIDLDLKLARFPLAAVPQLRDVPVALSGKLSGQVHLGGDLHHWSPGGVIEAAAVRVRDILLGDGRLDLVPGGDAIRLKGDFFHRFRVDGYLTLNPRVAVNVTVDFDDFPLDELIPELKKLAEMHGIASGHATISYDVASGLTRASLVLSKALLTLASEDDDAEHGGGRRSDEFSNEGDVLISTDGKTLTFEQARWRSRVGEFELKGDLSATASNLSVRGQIQLQLLEYFFSSLFSHTHGDAWADLTISGPAAHPQVVGTLDLKNAQLAPRGAERPFAAEGKVVFEPAAVSLHQLKVRLDGAEATAEARMALGPDWKPGELSAQLEGELSTTLLAWIFPDHVGDTSGRFAVRATAQGRWPEPRWSGTIEVHQPVFFHEKRLGRDVKVTSGRIQLDNYALALEAISAKVDESGDLRVDGTLDLRGFQLRRIDVHLQGDNLEWSQPGVYSLTLSPNLWLHGDSEKLRLSGPPDGSVGLTLVSGRYQQNFEYKDLVIRPRAVETDEPFYEGTPLLAALELDIEAASAGALAIRDNIADLDVSLPSLHIGGVLEKPRLEGTIFVEAGGHFQIPFLRADFISDKGSINFEAHKDFPEETPNLAIHASSDWTDKYDQIHHILLTVSGTYKEPYVDLSSTDGWDKQKVLAALFTGGAPDDLRHSLQNDPTSKAGPGTADGLAKTLSGQFIGSIIEDPLKHVFRLDTARLELGSDSVLIKLCPYNTRYVKLCGTADVGFVLTSRYDVKGELKLSDVVSVAGAVEHIEHGVDTVEDIVTREKLQLILRYPLH